MENKWDNQILRRQYIEEGRTLRELAKFYNVSHERVRQKLNDFEIPLRTIGGPKFTHDKMTLEEFLDKHKDNSFKSDWINSIVKRFIPESMMFCSDCGSTKRLHIHHIIYPAHNIDDIMILCCSCHRLRHSPKMNKLQRIRLYNDKINGMSRSNLASKYNIHIHHVDMIIQQMRYNLKTINRY